MMKTLPNELKVYHFWGPAGDLECPVLSVNLIEPTDCNPGVSNLASAVNLRSPKVTWEEGTQLRNCLEKTGPWLIAERARPTVGGASPRQVGGCGLCKG